MMITKSSQQTRIDCFGKILRAKYIAKPERMAETSKVTDVFEVSSNGSQTINRAGRIVRKTSHPLERPRRDLKTFTTPLT